MMRSLDACLLSALALFSVTTWARADVPISTALVASGLTLPVAAGAPAQDFQRLFVAEQRVGATGRVRVLDLATSTLQVASYLDVGPVGTSSEQGLLGLAFDPAFAANGFVYVAYTDPSGALVVARYRANAPFLTSTSADATSATTILVEPQPFVNNNGGWIGFGPDGFLYVALGDGGGINDPMGNAQSLESRLGKILRIDPNGADALPADPLNNYAIPATNPYVGVAGRDEIWALGLRNPWRCSFDRVTGDLFVADVGQASTEEINFQPAGAAARNYAWRCKEGLTCTGLSGCSCTDTALTGPLQIYPHTGGNCAVTGGYVYRGTEVCDLGGAYFYADYCSGRIWSFRIVGGGVSDLHDRTLELDPPGALTLGLVTSFGEDALGELYVLDQGGEVYRIRAGTGADCNANGVTDACDISAGTSLDLNLDGIPDECQASVVGICFGDGAGTACPCGNNGSAGRGCASSTFPGGARLASIGTPSLALDGLVLLGSGLSGTFAVFVQGTSEAAGGAGIVFGDGLRCATGTIIRLGTQAITGGNAEYPEIFDLPISLRGLITTTPSLRSYQIYYRDAAPTFCTSDTFNLSNGLRINWGV